MNSTPQKSIAAGSIQGKVHLSGAAGSIEDKLIVLGSAIDDGLIVSGAACWIDDKMKTSGAEPSAIDDEVTVSGSVIDEVLNMSGGPSDGTARGALAAQRARAKNLKRKERRKAAWRRKHAQQVKEVRA